MSKITVRKSNERGRTQLPWLDSYHSFSFDQYFDPNWKKFKTLRVINEDTVQKNAGFGAHPHRNMEIITYMISGQLEHEDNQGNKGVIHAGEIQRMSAGTGIMHSEMNPSKEDPAHLLQIWIIPAVKNLNPSYEQKRVEEKEGLTLIASSEEREGAVKIHQDCKIYKGQLAAGKGITQKVQAAWLQLISGELIVEGQELNSGDAAQIEDADEIEILANKDSEFLLFELE